MEVAGEDDLAALAASFNQMAETLQRHILRLEEMSRLQRRFTSDVSHELRTPLTTVRMAADLIFNSRDDFDPAVARSAELLQAELDRFEGLLAELLEISRFDAGFAALERRAGQPGPLVERVVDRLRAGGRAGRCDRRVDLPTDPVVAEVDVRRVERILRNLIGNAIEHGEGRPVAGTAGGPRGRGRDHRPRLRCRAQAGRGEAGVQPVLAGRPVAGPADRRHRAGPVDQRGGRPAAWRLAGGLGGARAGRSVPADRAVPGRRATGLLAAAAGSAPTSGHRARPSPSRGFLPRR